MIFNRVQINEMLSILKRYELIFIAGQLGVNFLTDIEKEILKASGIDLKTYKNSNGIIEHAFLFGILADAIGDDRAKKMNYNSFKKFLASGNFIPLTDEEEFALQQVKNRAYTDITNLGNRMRGAFSNSVIRNNQQQSLMVQKVIRDKTIEAVELRSGARTLASELANVSKDWEVDWLRIAYYLTHEAFNIGRSQNILKNHGADAEVYFDVFPEACHTCKELFLEDPEDPDSKPIVYKLSDLIANGNNIGRKAEDRLPTISPIHPYCRCIINYKEANLGWDEELRAFTKVTKKQSINPKLKNVKLDISVKKAEENNLPTFFSTKEDNIKAMKNNIDSFEKAHYDGELHPTKPWIWVSSANNGKGDWRMNKNTKNKPNDTTINDLGDTALRKLKSVGKDISVTDFINEIFFEGDFELNSIINFCKKYFKVDKDFIMKYTKFGGFENKRKNFIDDMLKKLEPFINEIIDLQNKRQLKELGYEMDERDKEYSKLYLTFDLIKSIESYSKPTDELIELESSYSRKGNLEIRGKVKRDDKEYNYSTEVIIAGGYNIQKIHYRYLTHTNLPKTNNQEKTKDLQQKIKKLTKIQKLNADILFYEEKIKKLEKELEENKVKTPDQIMDELRNSAWYLKWLPWDELVRRGVSDNFAVSEEEYAKKIADYESEQLERWYFQNIKRKGNDIKEYQQSIQKVKDRIEKL